MALEAWARGLMRGVRLSTSAGWAEPFTDESTKHVSVWEKATA